MGQMGHKVVKAFDVSPSNEASQTEISTSLLRYGSLAVVSQCFGFTVVLLTLAPSTSLKVPRGHSFGIVVPWGQ